MFASHQKKPWVNIELYIQSGIIESYALGLATRSEREEFEQLLPHYPELGLALSEFEYQLELFAIEHEVPPPAGTREQIEGRIRETPAVRRGGERHDRERGSQDSGPDYVHVEYSSNYIRVHKAWKTWFIILCILSKVFLALAIWFYVEYRHARMDLRRVQEQASGVPGPIK